MITTKTYAGILKILMVLFILRVLAQLIQRITPVSFLPPFEIWQSGALPYPVLLILQISIIAIMIKVVRQFSRQKVVPSKKRGILYLAAGIAYGGFMIVRLIIGLTVASPGSWFHAPIPTMFHLLLASFILTIGLFHKHENIQRTV